MKENGETLKPGKKKSGCQTLPTRTKFTRILRFSLFSSLAIILIISGLLKLSSEYTSSFLLPKMFYYLLGFLEIGLGLSNFFGWPISRKLSSFSCCLIVIVGIASSIFFPEKSCGCMGSIYLLSQKEHLLLATSVGAISSIVYYMEISSHKGGTNV